MHVTGIIYPTASTSEIAAAAWAAERERDNVQDRLQSQIAALLRRSPEPPDAPERT